MIKGKSIKNVEKYLKKLFEGERFYIAIRSVEAYSQELLRYGLDVRTLNNGESFLPRPIKNSTKYNSNGRIVVDKSVKEKREIERKYHNIDWHGNHHYGTYYQTRLCYKRNIIKPLEIELTYLNGDLLSPIIENYKKNQDIIKHIINMFLEIFGQCELLTEDFNTREAPRVRRLAWTVLPKGEYPWNEAKEHLNVVLDSIPNKYKTIINRRHEIISNEVPDFMAIGDQGFYGYVIYGFTKKDLYIFESNQPDNATYIFKGNWEDASNLTKSEILNSNLCELRLIHNRNWPNEIHKLVS